MVNKKVAVGKGISLSENADMLSPAFWFVSGLEFSITRRDVWWPVSATTCTNYIFIVQTLFSLYKLYFHHTNIIISVQTLIFIVQTLFSSYKLYFNRTNFVFIAQTLFSSYKLYFHRTNFIITVQTLFSRTNFIERAK